MDIGKIFISFVLVVLFYLLFGHESFSKLKKRGMTISHSESEPQNIKSPGNVSVYHFENLNFLLMLGIFLGLLSVNSFGLGWKCMKKNSIEDFKSCIRQNSKDYIKGINLKSYKQRSRLSKYDMYEVILPEDGSVPSKKGTNGTIFLNPSFVYIFCLFDKDFLLFVSNPLIVQRSCLRIKQNTYYTAVEIKVYIR